MKKPEFFIVGAPKCGTTAMSDYLSQHPDIFMATKELHYFGSDLGLRHNLSEAEYLQHFRKAGDEKILGEASVWYLFSKTAAKEIKTFAPNSKVLIMLRNPVDVVYSLHSQHLYDGNEDIQDFEIALNLDEERREGRSLPKSTGFLKLPAYRDTALFFEQVKRYLDVFGKEQVHIILYEDFVADTRKTVMDVLKFLGVNSDFQINYSLVNPNKKIRFFYLHRLMKHPSSLVKKGVRLLLPLRKLRHETMSLLFKWNLRLEKREELKPELRLRLKNFFSEDIRQLAQLINRDLSAWLK